MTIDIRITVVTLLVFVTGCAGTGITEQMSVNHVDLGSAVQANAVEAAEAKPDPQVAIEEAKETLLTRGRGFTANKKKSPPQTAAASGGYTLNFEKADIHAVVKHILGDLMGVSYMIDPSVVGSVSVATAEPVPRDAILTTLESLLKMSGAVLVKSGEVYLVTPSTGPDKWLSSPHIRSTISQVGFQSLIVPIHYIGVKQLVSILNPIIGEDRVLLADEGRNFVVLSGSRAELESAIDTIRIFDVDQMHGKSVGFFPLKYATANEVVGDLDSILDTAEGGLLGGALNIVPIERINAILVFAPQSNYVAQVQTWIERLDREAEGAGQSMYVYRVQNGRAEQLARTLSALFSADDNYASRGQGSLGSGSNSPSSTRASNGQAAGNLRSGGQGDGGTMANGVRIIADDQNNALVISATKSEYEKISQAIRQLDVLPLQVLVEATIVEVSLTDELSYGLQWFFKNKVGVNNGLGELFPLTVDPSFSYTVSNSSGQIRAVLDMLAGDSRLNVVSSPSLMVLDNRTATIKVGDQVPVRTSETTSLATSGSDPLVTSTIQYRDTGVLLEVVPRVNQGGMVTLDITQDVNDVDQTTTSEIDSPTIIQRRITTSVAVQSGETIVLGGLIRENKSNSKAGVPLIRKVPLLGKLFSSEVNTTSRTELLVLITPTAVEDVNDARLVTQEMSRKMKSLNLQ